MSKVKKMLERALKVNSQQTNIERFCRDVNSIDRDWDWFGAEEYIENEAFVSYLNSRDVIFNWLPEEHQQTAKYLFSLAFECYVKGQDDAGKIIIAVVTQWNNDYDY